MASSRKPKHTGNKRNNLPNPLSQTKPSQNKTTYQTRTLGQSVMVVYEDDDLIVLDKPIGMLSARVGEQGGISVFDLVKEHAKNKQRRSKYKTPNTNRNRRRHDEEGRPLPKPRLAWVIHRLDKDVSGLIVFAYTQTAYLNLKQQLKDRRVKRRYAALVQNNQGENNKAPKDKLTSQHTTPSAWTSHSDNTAPDSWQTIYSFLLDTGPNTPVAVLSQQEAEAHTTISSTSPTRSPKHQRPNSPAIPKRAVTHYRVLSENPNHRLVEVKLETGRKHQIRAHLACVGMPIAGDGIYGSTINPMRRIALHAAELELDHPVTGKRLAFTSPPHERFLRLASAQEDTWINRAKEEGPNQTIHHFTPHESATDSSQANSYTTEHSPSSPAPSTQQPSQHQSSPNQDAGWDHVADWYTGLLNQKRSDHHDQLVVPGVLRLLQAQPGQAVLDVACGEGLLCRQLASQGIQTVGVDAAPNLITHAKRNIQQDPHIKADTAHFYTHDARELSTLNTTPSTFDAATCVLALMNIEPLEPVFRGIYDKLKTGGRFTSVILHPCFRSPGQTSWAWDTTTTNNNNNNNNNNNPASNHHRSEHPYKQHSKRSSFNHKYSKQKSQHSFSNPNDAPSARTTDQQYRRVDAYLSPTHQSIVMNPGAASSGKHQQTTTTWHRPIQTYIRLLTEAGFVIDAMEEWASQRNSTSGPRAQEENRSRREIPMFLALRAIKTTTTNNNNNNDNDHAT